MSFSSTCVTVPFTTRYTLLTTNWRVNVCIPCDWELSSFGSENYSLACQIEYSYCFGLWYWVLITISLPPLPFSLLLSTVQANINVLPLRTWRYIEIHLMYECITENICSEWCKTCQIIRYVPVQHFRFILKWRNYAYINYGNKINIPEKNCLFFLFWIKNF